MSDREAVEHWAQVDRLLNQLLALPPADRASFVEEQTTNDPHLRDEVFALLAEFGTRGDLLDRPALGMISRGAPAPDLEPGYRIGAYEVMSLLGRGGMGEVYRAARADGQFEHHVALKLLRLDAIDHLDLFVSERRILAKLAHPGIARLYDAGIGEDGRPYMVMELVDGVPITVWCQQRRTTVRERLGLFMQVCEAVAYAHQNLVIHRDLKPGNILVDTEGRIKLLDFGVSGRLSDAMIDAKYDTPFTLSYAAPEQLAKATVSTATDIYALGVILFVLLTNRSPWNFGDIPEAVALDKVLNEIAPMPSVIAAGMASPIVPVRQLAGDLDAIVSKALLKEPTERYATVSALCADVQRHLDGEPVLAREGNQLYVFGRFMRRHRWAVGGVSLLIVSLAIGLASTAWQAQRAEREAARATATKDFLLSVFRANDPRIASDKPRGEISARELLDLGSTRIEKDFAGQPELQIELLGLTAAIYDNLSDEERYAVLQKRRIELARAHYGPAHPIVIEGLISEADAACLRQDYAKANRLLDETDALLKTSGQDHGLLRADWWRTKARTLGVVADGQDKRGYALERALALYAKLAPRSNGYAAALNMVSRDHTEQGKHVQAMQVLEQALAVAMAATDRDDALIADFLTNLARKQEKLGEFVAAESAYKRAEDLAQVTYGGHHSAYWLTLAYHARMLHQRGQRERANALFAQMLATIPRGWKTNTNDKWARETYAECLAAEGRWHDAVPLLEAAHDTYLKQPQYEYDVREVRRKLGDAYDRAGRIEEARRLLQASRDEYLAKEGPDSAWTLRIRERWGRFLLDHSALGDADFVVAEAEFRAVVEQAAERPLLEPALARSGLARIAAARGDIVDAVNESRLALAALNRVDGLYDLRAQPQLWLVHSAVLLKSGDAAGARLSAEKALAASLIYDDPSSRTILAAKAALRAATAAGSQM